MKKLILISLFLSSFTLFAREVKDTFVVDIYDNFVKVVSPEKLTKQMRVIVKNRTLTKIYGHIQSPDGDWKEYFSLKSEKTASLPIKTGSFKKFILFSQAPPFQEVWLIPGKRVYEIPSQEKKISFKTTDIKRR